MGLFNSLGVAGEEEGEKGVAGGGEKGVAGEEEGEAHNFPVHPEARFLERFKIRVLSKPRAWDSREQGWEFDHRYFDRMIVFFVIERSIRS